MTRSKFFIPPCEATGAPVFGQDKPWLAPLAGYSDLPFRLLCRGQGAAVCETEMVSARGLLYQNGRTPELLANCVEDSPLVVQLFGGEPEIMAQAVLALRAAGYYWFDLNVGCSVRKVLRQGAGAALLEDIPRLLAIARAMLAASSGADGHPPGMVGFKIRAGANAAKNVLPDLPLRLEELGASWICLHPRYASQGFQGKAHWEMLADLEPRLRIPLLASGDLLSAPAGLACLEETGAAGLMYARGALYNPAIFRRHLELLQGLAGREMEAYELRALIDAHLALSKKYGNPKRAFAKMRSLLPRYARGLPGVGELRRGLCLCGDWDGLENVLNQFLPGKQA